jgi:hypothetical protein
MSENKKLFVFKSPADYIPWIISAAVLVSMTVILRFQERIWWCKLGDYAIYINEAWNSPHTSQHFLDPYTFTHILHGILFFWLASLIFYKLPPAWRFFIAIFVESAWEVLENSGYIIEKYRENTAALDYFGDSVSNSIGDVLACAVGFFIAHKLGWRRSIVFFILVEIILIFWIRDSLLINIIMLIHPFEAIKTWQMSV